MITLKKNMWYAIDDKPFHYLAVRATPDDANKEEAGEKNFFIIEIQDRTPCGSRAYATEYITLSANELCVMVGGKKREKLEIKV